MKKLVQLSVSLLALGGAALLFTFAIYIAVRWFN